MSNLTRKYFDRLHNAMMTKIEDYASGYRYVISRHLELPSQEFTALSKAHRECNFDMLHFGHAKAYAHLAREKS